MTTIEKENLYNQSLDALKKTGVRITPQRRAVLKFMIDAENHPTADDVYQALAPHHPNMSVATIYNNLKLFKQTGLIKELTYGDASSRFDFDSDKHYHIICSSCGKITDFHVSGLEEVEQMAANSTNYSVSHHRLELYGVCNECKQAED